MILLIILLLAGVLVNGDEVNEINILFSQSILNTHEMNKFEPFFISHNEKIMINEKWNCYLRKSDVKMVDLQISESANELVLLHPQFIGRTLFKCNKNEIKLEGVIQWNASYERLSLNLMDQKVKSSPSTPEFNYSSGDCNIIQKLMKYFEVEVILKRGILNNSIFKVVFPFLENMKIGELSSIQFGDLTNCDDTKPLIPYKSSFIEDNLTELRIPSKCLLNKLKKLLPNDEIQNIGFGGQQFLCKMENLEIGFLERKPKLNGKILCQNENSTKIILEEYFISILEKQENILQTHNERIKISFKAGELKWTNSHEDLSLIILSQIANDFKTIINTQLSKARIEIPGYIELWGGFILNVEFTQLTDVGFSLYCQNEIRILSGKFDDERTDGSEWSLLNIIQFQAFFEFMICGIFVLIIDILFGFEYLCGKICKHKEANDDSEDLSYDEKEFLVSKKPHENEEILERNIEEMKNKQNKENQNYQEIQNTMKETNENERIGINNQLIESDKQLIHNNNNENEKHHELQTGNEHNLPENISNSNIDFDRGFVSFQEIETHSNHSLQINEFEQRKEEEKQAFGDESNYQNFLPNQTYKEQEDDYYENSSCHSSISDHNLKQNIKSTDNNFEEQNENIVKLNYGHLSPLELNASFHESFKGSNIEVLPANFTSIEMKGFGGTSLVNMKLIKDRIYEIRFKIDRGKNQIYFGISKKINYELNFAQTSDGFGIESGGYKEHDYEYMEYCDTFGEGSCITMIIDKFQGSLSYIINGKHFGNAFEEYRIRQEDFYPAVAPGTKGTLISIGTCFSYSKEIY